MFALFPEFGARIRSQDLWPFLISETGLKFLIWTQSEIHPGNRASRPRSTRLMWRGPLLANPDSFFSALIQNFLWISLQPFEKRINGRRDRIWFQNLYYYMRNLCNLIGLEQWYFSLIWNTLLREMFVTCLFRDFHVHIYIWRHSNFAIWAQQFKFHGQYYLICPWIKRLYQRNNHIKIAKHNCRT